MGEPSALPREDPPTNEEYHLPVTTLPARALLGRFPKDTGKSSSRLADIEKQAKKTPGPGKYCGQPDWGKMAGVLSRAVAIRTGEKWRGF